eukprot:7386888-Prymnesium_polylepis.2
MRAIVHLHTLFARGVRTRLHALSSGVAHKLDGVAAKHVATVDEGSPALATRVEPSRVHCLVGAVGKEVVLDKQVDAVRKVAAAEHAVVRRPLDHIRHVRVADAPEEDSRLVGALPLRGRRDAALGHAHVAPRQRGRVAAGRAHAHAPDGEDVALGHDGVARVLEQDAVRAVVVHVEPLHDEPARAGRVDADVPPIANLEVREGGVGHFGADVDDRARLVRQDGRLAHVAARRVKVEQPVRLIDVVLAGRVELREDVHSHPARVGLAGGPVGKEGHVERVFASLVHTRQLHVLVGPVPLKVAVQEGELAGVVDLRLPGRHPRGVRHLGEIDREVGVGIPAADRRVLELPDAVVRNVGPPRERHGLAPIDERHLVVVAVDDAVCRRAAARTQHSDAGRFE